MTRPTNTGIPRDRNSRTEIRKHCYTALDSHSNYSRLHISNAILISMLSCSLQVSMLDHCPCVIVSSALCALFLVCQCCVPTCLVCPLMSMATGDSAKAVSSPQLQRHCPNQPPPPLCQSNTATQAINSAEVFPLATRKCCVSEWVCACVCVGGGEVFSIHLL